MKKIKELIIAVAIPEMVGISSAVLTAGTMDAYQSLSRPSISPPGWVFGPVWTMLYALMGYASFRIWRNIKSDPRAKVALYVYAFQLFLNFMWSILFFRLGLRGVAFAHIILLLAFIIATTVRFFKIDRWAGLVMLPYIAWVSFASVLNYLVWVMNR